MTTNTRFRLARLTAIALATGGLALAGCSQRDQNEAKADAKQAGAEMKADVKEAAADVKAKTAEARADASTAIDKAKVSVADATITTSVKAELAKDPTLKARDINVDTNAGRVFLRGTAPTTEARDRATTLASAVSGVVSVENQLTVAAS